MVEHIRILGIPISKVDLLSASSLICNWPAQPKPRTIFVREVASLMAAVDEPRLADLHESADLVVADGLPLVWLGRLRGAGRALGRVAGADLVNAVCERSQRNDQSHYFYGGLPGVAEQMAERLRARYPALKVAGVFSPRMRSIGPGFTVDKDILAEVDHIKSLNPDFIWVGVSSPKQEYWMAAVAPLFERGVFIGVGAAFNFHAGTVKRAPLWMQRSGLEWSHRLFLEPRRLWRRYVFSAPRFVIMGLLEILSGGVKSEATLRQGEKYSSTTDALSDDIFTR